MKHCTCDSGAASLRHSWEEQARARLADWHNLPKPKWRDAIRALMSPATRMHRYRNLRSAIFYDAVDDLDCKGR